MTFEQVMEFTSGVSSHAAFEEPAARLFFDTLMSLKPFSTIVEVGCEFGRSTSILMQVAKERGHEVLLVDPFVDPASAPKLVEMLRKLDTPYRLYVMRMAEVKQWWLPAHIDLVHIDGDHNEAGISLDCDRLLHRVVTGGYACFHDVECASLPDVIKVVSERMQPDEWQEVGVAASLGVWRRLADKIE